MSRFHDYLAIQGRGTVALPAELRRKYRLDEAGAQLEITEREDGVLELRPTLPVPVDELWFRSEAHRDPSPKHPPDPTTPGTASR